MVRVLGYQCNLALTVACVGLLVGCSQPDLRTSALNITVLTGLETNAILAASEIVVGSERFPFGLVGKNGQLINGAEVRVKFYNLETDHPKLKSEAEAVFHTIHGVSPHEHTDGQIHLHQEARGIYVVDGIQFDEPGIWQADMEIKEPATTTSRAAKLAFQVLERSSTLNVGDRVPYSNHLTIHDVENLKEITTHYPPVPEMYQLTVAQALALGKPFFVAFAAPAFCVSRMCGPVTDVVGRLANTYGEVANFLHIEPWILDEARNAGRLVPTKTMLEWGLSSEPWVFVVGVDGRVQARFEGLVSMEELARELEISLR
jgi:hypothetical protein